jgi:hypothetical protein
MDLFSSKAGMHRDINYKEPSSKARENFKRGDEKGAMGPRDPVQLHLALRGLKLVVRRQRRKGRMKCRTEPSEMLLLHRFPGIGAATQNQTTTRWSNVSFGDLDSGS